MTRVPRWARNPLRAYDAEGREIRPSTVGSIRSEEGVEAILAYCNAIGCGHSGRVSILTLPADLAIPDIVLLLRCSRCGRRRDAQIIPDRRDWKAARKRDDARRY